MYHFHGISTFHDCRAIGDKIFSFETSVCLERIQGEEKKYDDRAIYEPDLSNKKTRLASHMRSHNSFLVLLPN